MAVASFLNSTLESFRVGWKVESNWTDPVLFATYQIVRPLASLMIVAFIVIIGAYAGASSSNAFFNQYMAWLIIGNAFFAYVIQTTAGMGILVHVDRSAYEVLKNIYLSPATLYPYLIVRGLVLVLNSTISVELSLFFSVAILH